MKKYTVLAIILAVIIVFGIGAEAATIDKTASVSATATISGSTSLNVSPASITYGTTNVDAYPTDPSNGKVVITYTSNYNPWKIDIYTNNTQVPNSTSPNGRYAKGGLATADGKAVIACKWVAKVGSNTTVPTVPTATAYNFVKDKRDEDDPLTTGTGKDESWAAAFASGYANIASGTPGGGYCVDPTKPEPYQGDAITGSIAVYIAGGFGTGFVSPAVIGGAGSYSSNIYFDLYHE
jgi:hypothetical protein